MRYLDAKRARESTEENKMQTGSRTDQQDSASTLARQLGVDIRNVEATGDHGEVLPKDVRAHAKKVKAENQKNPPISAPPISTPKSEPKPEQK